MAGQSSIKIKRDKMGNGQFESSATCLSKLCNSVHIKLNGEALFNYTSLALDASSENLLFELPMQCQWLLSTYLFSS